MLANANVEPNWNLFVFHCNGWKFILEFQRQIKSHKIRLRSHSDQLASKLEDGVKLVLGICTKLKGEHLIFECQHLKGGSGERVCT